MSKSVVVDPLDESLTEFYNEYYVLSYITRYSNVIRIKNESVAEHSFFVALLVLKLYDDYDFDLSKALSMALVHDILEADVNDITHYTKKKYPLIGLAVKKAEQEASEQLTGIVKESFDYTQESSVESIVLHLADVTQCSQYAHHECQLGNTGYMQKVYQESVARTKELRKLLNPHKRKVSK